MTRAVVILVPPAAPMTSFTLPSSPTAFNNVFTSASKSSIRRFVITEKAPTRSLNVKLGPRRNYHMGHYAGGYKTLC